MKTLRIATRKSPLALWQAEKVARDLSATHPDLRCELVPMSTSGDRFLDQSLADIGGKGLFVKELEQALLDNRADIAVHSMKDVTTELPNDLHIAVILSREDPRDAFVSPNYATLAELPEGARVGTSSLRRGCQLLAARPDLHLVPLRGNVNTRLAKLDGGECEAAILATAGLVRLGMADRIRQRIEPELLLPAIGQGALGIECRRQDARIEPLIAPLNDPDSALRTRVERDFNAALGGGCHVPVAGYAELTAAGLRLRGLVGSPDGSQMLRAEVQDSVAAAGKLGTQLANSLLARGAGEILEEFHQDADT